MILNPYRDPLLLKGQLHVVSRHTRRADTTGQDLNAAFAPVPSLRLHAFQLCVEGRCTLCVNGPLAGLRHKVTCSQPHHEYWYPFHFLHDSFILWRKSSEVHYPLFITVQLKVDFKARGNLYRICQ
jgi:hypothetical protein